MSEVRKIAAILVADVVGYSRLAGADEDRTLWRDSGRCAAIRSYPAVAVPSRPHRQAHRRRAASPSSAASSTPCVARIAKCSTAIVERNAGVALDNRRIEFPHRHSSRATWSRRADGDLMGDGVKIAARLEGIAAPRAICLSEDAYRQVRAAGSVSPPCDLGLDPTQEHRRGRSGSIRCKSASRPKRRLGQSAGPSKSALVQAALGALARTHGDAPSDRHLNRISCCCCVWGAHLVSVATTYTDSPEREFS